MKLFNHNTQDWIQVEIQLVTKDDFKRIQSSKEFLFDWSDEKHSVIYKLIERSTENILGLVSVTDYPEEFRLHINLLESSTSNVGKNKKIEGIAGNLISHLIIEAFKKGYNGFVSLISKTELIEHYQSKYGFKKIGNGLAIEGVKAEQLIRKYHEP